MGKSTYFNTSRVLTVILGGGAGTRLFPLTMERAKPAVPLGAKYRLVDIPISNCIHSDLRRIYLLTQFNSASLHRHIARSYKFDHFSAGFVEILAAEQTLTDSSWYEGTADAVRKNLIHFMDHAFDHVLVLSGDHLYRMDYRDLLNHHVEREADVTVATIAVPREDVPGFGVMKMDATQRITRFVEKPKDRAVQDSLQLEPDWCPRLGLESGREWFLASMGIYVFGRDLLVRLLDNELADFGTHVIPEAIPGHRVFSYVFNSYWRDIGTIRAFFEANLDLTAEKPPFDFFDMAAPIFTRPRYLPASRIDGCSIRQSLVGDGCQLQEAEVNTCVLGLRSFVGPGSRLERTVMMGADYFESEAAMRANTDAGVPRIGVGRNSRIENAIIDKNARIGDNCVISPAGKPTELDHPLYFIRDGVVIVPKNGMIPHGTIF